MHRRPGRFLNMLAVENIAADMEFCERAEPTPQTNHRTALVVQVNNRCARKIVTKIARIRDSFTIIGIDMVGETRVELAHFIDDLARHHNRSARNVTGNEWFGHIPIEVQKMLPRKTIVREQPRDERTRAE